MKLTLLPFNQHACKKINILTLDDITTHVLEMCKDTSKPLCTLLDEGGRATMMKFGQEKRRAFVEKECKILSLLTNFPHIEKLLWTADRADTKFMLIEFYLPLRTNISTFKQLVQGGSDSEIRCALFQLLFTLIHLRQMFPDFRHNDLKSDNVLVTDCTHHHSYALSVEGERKTFRTSGCSVKLIDFESAHFSSLGPQSENETSVEFGISARPCEIFDIHLLLYDALLNCNPNAKESLYMFATAFIPKHFFHSKHLTVKCRLKHDDQLPYCGVLKAMVCHPYFAHLRGKSHEVVAYEIL